MSFPIKPGKVTCAGLVGILMVLPNSIWKGPDAKVQPVAKPKMERTSDSSGSGVKFRKMPR
jgi:hypothetical protein